MEITALVDGENGPVYETLWIKLAEIPELRRGESGL